MAKIKESAPKPRKKRGDIVPTQKSEIKAVIGKHCLSFAKAKKMIREKILAQGFELGEELTDGVLILRVFHKGKPFTSIAIPSNIPETCASKKIESLLFDSITAGLKDPALIGGVAVKRGTRNY